MDLLDTALLGNAIALRVPAVVAAAAKETLDVVEAVVPALLFVMGLVASGVVGYLTIKVLPRHLTNHLLTAVAVSRFALAAITAAWLMS